MKGTTTVLAAAMMIFAGTLFADCEKDGECDKKDGKKGHSSMRGGMRGGKGCEMMMKALNLTDDQKTQMKTIHETNSKKMQEAGKAVGEARKALMEAASSEDVSESTVRTLSSQLADAIAVMALNKAQMMKDVKAILTNEQKVKFDKKRAEMKKRMEKMGGRSMHGRSKKSGCDKNSKKGDEDSKKGCDGC